MSFNEGAELDTSQVLGGGGGGGLTFGECKTGADANRQYREARTVICSGQTQSACGQRWFLTGSIQSCDTLNAEQL